MFNKFTKGAMQGPLGDIGKHGDLITKILIHKKNVGAMQGPFGEIGRHGD